MYISCPFLEGIRNDRFCRSSDLLRIYRLPTIRILAVAQVIGKSCNRRSQQRDCLGVTPNSLFMEYTKGILQQNRKAKIGKIYVLFIIGCSIS